MTARKINGYLKKECQRSRIFCLILTICLVCVSNTGCWDAREVDEWAYAYSIGVDKGVENVLRFSFQIPSIKQQSGGGSGGGGNTSEQSNYTTLSIDAPTFYTGVDMVEASFSRKLSYMHTKYLIIGEDIAREGVERFINGMVRSRQIRRITHIIIVRGKASEFLANFSPVLTSAISKAQEGFMNQENETGFFVNTTYQDLLVDLKTSYRMAAAPLVSMNDFSNYKTSGNPPEDFVAGGKYYAGELPRKGGNNFEFYGTALFDGDKMVGMLNGIQSRMLLMVRGDFTRASISMQDPQNKKLRISMDTKLQKKPDIKVDISSGKPVINVKLFLEGDMQNVQSPIEYESVKLKPILENKFKEDIKGYLNETIKICQNLNVDVFGFGEKAVRHFLTIQEWEAYNWLSHFKDAEINTEVEFTIRRTGTLLKTNPTRNSQGVKQ